MTLLYDELVAMTTAAVTVSQASVAKLQIYPPTPIDFRLSLNNDVMYNFSQMRRVVNEVVLPVIFSLGILGNALNAVLLTRRRECVDSTSARASTTFERSAAVGLVALTSSDLAFCLVGFGRVLFVGVPAEWRVWTIMGVYFLAYRGALLNLFLFTSTWMIVLVSVERYLAVCHPFRAGRLIRVRRTVGAHLSVVVVSVLVNVPLFLRNNVMTKCSPTSLFVPRPITTSSLMTSSSSTSSTFGWDSYDAAANTTTSGLPCVEYYFVASSELFKSFPGFLYAHRIVWFALGTFVPLVLIAYSNVRLIREVCSIRRHSIAVSTGGLQTSTRLRHSSSSHTTSSRTRCISAASTSSMPGGDVDRAVALRLTMTLIAIVVCFVVLVCPSMFVQFAWFTVVEVTSTAASSPSGASWSGTNVTRIEQARSTISRTVTHQIPFQTALLVTDLMQAIKFSSNFLLYCVVSRSFRRTFGRLFYMNRCRESLRTRNNSVSQQDTSFIKQRPGLSLIMTAQKDKEVTA